MKRIFIVGNWKSNKTIDEAEKWLQHLTSKIDDLSINNKEVIICPPFTLLPILRSYIIDHKLPISLGAQDISPFDEGAFTGEVNGKQIKEFADYVIVGHSERRKNFHENEEAINNKLIQAQKHGLTPILCISDRTQLQTMNHELITKNLIIAYEPLFAIGSGKPDTPDNAESMAVKIKELAGNIPVIYGGSVNASNVNSFTSRNAIDGVLPGSASLDAIEFAKIIKNA